MDRLLQARQRSIHGAEGLADEARWLRDRLRSGQLDRRRVEVAGALGYEAAALALDQDFGLPLGALVRDLRLLERVVGAELAHAVEWGADFYRPTLAGLSLSARLLAGGDGMAGLPRRLEHAEFLLRTDSRAERSARFESMYQALRSFGDALREPEAGARAGALNEARRALAEVRADMLAPAGALRRVRWTLGRELLGQREDPAPYVSRAFLAAVYGFVQDPAQHYGDLVARGREGGWRYRGRSWSEWQAALRDSRGARSEFAQAHLFELCEVSALDRAVVAALTLSCLIEPERLSAATNSSCAANRVAEVQLKLLNGTSGSPLGFWAWLTDDFEDLFGCGGADEFYDALAQGMDLEACLGEPGLCSETVPACTRGRRAVRRRVEAGAEHLFALQACSAWVTSRDHSVLPSLRRLLVSPKREERRLALRGLSEQLGQHLPQVVSSLRLEVDAGDGEAVLLVLQLLRQRTSNMPQRWWLELRREVDRLRPVGQMRLLCEEELARLRISA